MAKKKVKKKEVSDIGANVEQALDHASDGRFALGWVERLSYEEAEDHLDEADMQFSMAIDELQSAKKKLGAIQRRLLKK